MRLRLSRLVPPPKLKRFLPYRDLPVAILDIGCGGGRTIYKLAAIATKGKVYGVDSSETSVAASRKTNEECIKSRRVEILHGSVSHLPFPDQMFALATAVETHFYWPDLPADMREVSRVLKPGGALVINGCKASRLGII